MTWDERWSKDPIVEKWSRPSQPLLKLARELRQQDGSTGSFERALDLGCGPGRHVIALAKEGYQVVGSDFSEPAVRHAREWLEREGLTGTVEQRLITEFPWPDGSFDLVVAYNSIYYATQEDMHAVVRDMHRVLRPGGYLWVTLKSTEAGSFGRGTEIETNTFWRPKKEAPIHFSTQEEVDALFSDFELVSTERRDYVKQKKAKQKRHVKWKLVLRKPVATGV